MLRSVCTRVGVVACVVLLAAVFADRLLLEMAVRNLNGNFDSYAMSLISSKMVHDFASVEPHLRCTDPEKRRRLVEILNGLALQSRSVYSSSEIEVPVRHYGFLGVSESDDTYRLALDGLLAAMPAQPSVNEAQEIEQVLSRFPDRILIEALGESEIPAAFKRKLLTYLNRTGRIESIETDGWASLE
jgi:hypothetical protein